ncbi:MAG: carbamoyltransferase [Draconibacterium sp.]
MNKILGISAFYHDSAAAITVDGEIMAAAQEERFTRNKHTSDFPVKAIEFCLTHTGLSIDELDAVVFYDKPLLKFERLLETYYSFAPKGIQSFIKAIPVWLDEKLFLKKKIYDGLAQVHGFNKKKLKILFPEHHLSHAASAFYPSPFNEASILTIDGVGEWATASISHGKNGTIKLIKELNFPHSVGLLYSAFTYYLGFTVNSGEYKLMGLAPYGNPASEETLRFIEQIKQHLVTIHDDGSIWLNQKYFNYASGLKMVHDKRWETLFGFKKKEPEEKIQQHHCNLAYAIQAVTEEIVLKMALEAKSLTGVENLCMAGGVALNCVANGKLLKSHNFTDIFIQPAAGDAGGAVGAALAAHYMYFDQPRHTNGQEDRMNGAYLGPDFSEKEIMLMSKKNKARFRKFEEYDKLAYEAAKLISEGNVVGWFQGRMEFGPRALGNRSILGDARNLDMQKRLNLKIKYREGFRPFAPSVLAEDAPEYFELETNSPYMLLIAQVQSERCKSLPNNYFELDLFDRLYFQRSDIQAVTHLDFSARIQTVHKQTNPRYWELLNSFKQQTGYGLLVNTSMNVRGEPIVCTPDDAYRCFMSTDMDYLVVNDFLFVKTEQPDWQNKEKWKQEFKLD